KRLAVGDLRLGRERTSPLGRPASALPSREPRAASLHMRPVPKTSSTTFEAGTYPVLRDAEFDFIRHVVGENAGIKLGPNKRQLGLDSYEAYCNYVREAGPEELVGLINALTTNVTSFFRENHHFEALASYMLPEALKRNALSRRLRIWSAGCSTGEEAYCIAMT